MPANVSRTGIVVAAVGSKEPWIPSMKEPADIDIVWLSFPQPPEALTAPLDRPTLKNSFEKLTALWRQMAPRLSEAAGGGNPIPPSDPAHPP